MPNKKEKLTLIGLIRARAPRLLAFSTCLGLLAGICYSFIIPFLLHGLQIQQGLVTNNGADAPFAQFISEHYVAIFFMICCGIITARAASLIIVNFVVKDVTADLRIGLCEKINKVNVREVETLGFSRLINILMDDINNISFAAVCLPLMCIEMVTVVGLLAYLAYLDLVVFAFVLASVAIGVSLLHFPMKLSSRFMDRSRSVRDHVQQGIRGVLFGSYELKLNNEKARQYINDEIAMPERASIKLDKVADSIMHSVGNFGSLLSFVIIGLVAFILPKFVVFSSGDTYGMVMALLYLIGPITMLLSLMPNVQRGNVALSRVMELTSLEEERSTDNGVLDEWKNYCVEAIEYKYTKDGNEHDNGFELSPTTLSFKRGEVVFIVGGNGSGKSTLAKVLSLHYRPSAGTMRFDNQLISAGNLKSAREKIAVIYSNYFLFNKLYRKLSLADGQKVNHYLRVLELDSKTRLIGDEFTTTELSDGQRRRLALLVALMEDKDIYIFDEWAADQDPRFKEAFYTDVIPEIKRQGKLVLVITHDDRYFSCADRVIHMEDGRVRSEEVIGKSASRDSQNAKASGSRSIFSVSAGVGAEQLDA